ncbi:MAG: 5'(3')-deoxyribonucleotidase [Chitinophagales bacterium]
MNKRIAIDMDEVMADPISRFEEWYFRDFGERISYPRLASKMFTDMIPNEHRETVKRYLYTKGFFADLPIIEGSQEVVKELMDNGYEIFIATAAMQFRSSFEDKYDWLMQYFPFIPWKNIVFCGNKSIIHADYLIDDSPYQLKAFSGTGLLFDAHHNQDETGFHRVHTWQEVRAYFLEQ